MTPSPAPDATAAPATPDEGAAAPLADAGARVEVSPPAWRSPLALGGLAVVALARLLSLPRSLWEFDEVLFVRGVVRFDPVHHRPHPPGFPVIVGLGKLLAPLVGDPFRALVASSVLASLVGFLALVDAFSRLAGGSAPERTRDLRVGVAGALLFALSPPMLLYGPLALSDAPAMAFLALMLAAGARVATSASAGRAAALALGAFASLAVGARPQLAPVVLPALGLAVLLAPRSRVVRTLALAAAGFAAVTLAWLLPLAAACGGPRGLLALLGRQAGNVAAADAGAARAAYSPTAVLLRFTAHPWGPKLLAIPVLALAALGLVVLARRRATPALPLLLLALVNLLFALRVMDPADAVRYALPTLLAVAALAALGADALASRLRAPWVLALATGALAVGFLVYTFPLLRERVGGPSPPVAALEWARAHLPRDARLLVDPYLAPHASELLGDRDLRLADPTLSALDGARGRSAWLLLDGESEWPDTVAFRWMPSGAYDKLTRGHYRVASWSPLPARCGGLGGGFGWEPDVRDPRFRWLAPLATLRWSGGPGVLELRFALPAEAPYPLVLVTAALPGGTPSYVTVARGGSGVLHLPVPAGASSISLQTDRAFVPAEAGVGRDRRRLGIQLLGCPALVAAPPPV